MLNRVFIAAGCMLFVTSIYALDGAGNSDSVIKLFKPNKTPSSSQQLANYYDHASYYPKAKYELYFGLGGVYSAASIKRTLTYSLCGIPQSETDKFSPDGFGVKGSVGAGVYYRHMYFGLEAFGVWDNADASVSKNNSKVTAKIDYSIGGSLLAGIQVFKPALIFLRAGVTNSRFNLTPTSEVLSSLSKQNKNAWGINLGAGVRAHFTKHFGASLEYMFTKYQDITSTYNNSGAAISFHNKFSTTSNQVALNLELYL